MGEAHFGFLTIFQPAFFMQNFCSPIVERMFPGLAESHILSLPFNADRNFDLIDNSFLVSQSNPTVDNMGKWWSSQLI